MRSLASLARGIDAINEWIGRTVAWLALGMVLIQVIVVVMRYVFGLSILMMQESIWYMHAIVFLTAAGYTLLHNGHVRVDILYGNVGPIAKARIDLFGVIFILLPICVMIWWVSWPYVMAAWAVHEGSVEVSGVPGVYLLKTCMLIYAGGLGIQGVSLAIKSWFTLMGIEAGIAIKDDAGEPGL
ncbi:MAG: TRAP transporter small permease subunit [Proteobacteria bacterium]|nr:TRAP transporter small permease subunit [Pseudomonadota bacterium]